jgi:predicted MFS family arabinose efflux permease
MWSASFFLGNFVGPTASGIAVEAYGFQSVTLVFFALYMCAMCMDLGELFYTVQRNKKKAEYKELE